MSRGKKKALKGIKSEMPVLRNRNLILSEKSAFSIKEEYKTLRTNILFSIPTEGCKVIGISSAQPLEGKSINCLNLAITFAQMNARVLLIDCDLRLPSQARLLDMDAIPGISNVLAGMSKAEDTIQKTKYSGFDVILSGNIPPNPSELLGSDKMGRVIEGLSHKYDYIFIDLPPINLVADALVISKYLSGLVLIARASFTKRDSLIKSISKLELADANIIGIVLTDVKNKKHLGGKYGSYPKYGKYARDVNSNK